MYTKRSSFASSPVVRLSAAISALAAGFLTLSVGNILRDINQGPRVDFNVEQITWWTHVQISPEKVSHPESEKIISESVQITQSQTASIESVSKEVRQFEIDQARARAKASLAERAQRRARLASEKRIALRRAVVKVVSTAQAAGSAELTLAEVNSPIAMNTQTEHQRMQGLHSLLQKRWVMAMTTQPQSEVIVSNQDLQVEPKIELKREPRVFAKRILNKRIRQQTKKTEVIHVAHVQEVAPAKPVAKSALPVIQPQAKAQLLSLSTPEKANELPRLTQLKPVNTQPEVVHAVTAKKIDTIKMAQSQAERNSAALLNRNEKSEVTPVQEFGPQPQTFASAVTTQSPSTILNAASPVEAPSTAVKTSNDYSLVSSQNGATPVTTQVVTGACQVSDLGTEAFTDGSRSFLAHRKVISHEGPEYGKQSRWVEVSESLGHWSTIHWEACHDEALAPLLSHFTVNSLVRLGKLQSQKGLSSSEIVEHGSDKGIVFGKVPAGWQVELVSDGTDALAERVKKWSGAPVIQFEKPRKLSEAVVVLQRTATGELKQAPADSTEVDRYFAFLRVVPETLILKVKRPGSSEGAAVVIPVKPGVATYIDIPNPQRKTLRGRIFDARSANPKAMSGIRLGILGQDGKSTTTDAGGSFRFQDLLTLGDHSVFLEAHRQPELYSHRYKLGSALDQSLNLFYFKQQSMIDLVGQLEGGVSEKSGVIIGALPETVATTKSRGLLAFDTPIAMNASLPPETYTLSPKNRLLVRAPLEEQSARFISVQVPEGGNISKVVNSGGEPIWSHLTLARPAQVNVVGPN